MYEMRNSKNEILYIINEMEEIYKILLNYDSEYHEDNLSNSSIKDSTKSVVSNLDEIFANVIFHQTGYTPDENYNKDDLDEEMNDSYIGEILNSAASIKATIDTNIDKYLKFAGESQLIIHDYRSDSDDDSDFEQVDIDETAQTLGYEFTDPYLPNTSFMEPEEYFANDFFNTEKN
ncbi:hypothetical protein AYI70_g7520, partial [Smittium culicis]